MNIEPFVIETVTPPQDDLFEKIKRSSLSLEEHDVIAISSKVVSIHEGRCIPKDRKNKDTLVKKEAELYLEREHTPGRAVIHTLKNGILIPSSGIDPFAGHYVLWPENPQKSAEELLLWFKKEYAIKNLYLIITDSRSVFLRRGVVGIALAWAGFEPLYDNRSRTDLLGFKSGGSQTNIPDSLAASAVFVMGESNEQTPIVRIRNAPYVRTAQIKRKDKHNSFSFTPDEDIFAPFLKGVPWKKGEANTPH